MNKIKLFAFLFISMTIASCSSDSSGDSVDATDHFTYKENGVDIPVPSITAIRHEDNIEIMAMNADGRSMFLYFNKFGQLIRATSTSTNSDPFNVKNSAFNFSLNYFNFTLVAIDEGSKIVKVNYSGKLFNDEYDLGSSPSVNVEGSANVHYTEATPEITGLGVTANIGGNNWRSLKYGITSNNGDVQNVVVEENSDDAYKIGFYMNQSDTLTGTYNFTGTSTNNKVVLSKYDPATNEYVYYTCNGTFKLDQKVSDGFGHTLISGTFNLTAVHNGTTIQITNGVFKEYYFW